MDLFDRSDGAASGTDQAIRLDNQRHRANGYTDGYAIDHDKDSGLHHISLCLAHYIRRTSFKFIQKKMIFFTLAGS